MTISTKKPFVARWGIIGSGWISSEFCKDVALVRPEISDVLHSIVAVGSRDKAKAAKFITEFCPNGGNAQATGIESSKPRAVGNYDDVYNDPDVDIIYVGTPNQEHFKNCKAALEAGKHCLLEKPATLNKNEWELLVKIATERKLFLMEAVWTRFLPLTLKLQKLIHEEKAIGDIKALWSDFSMHFLGKMPMDHRAFNINAAGGSMLDLGPYTLLPAMLYLYKSPANELTPPENVVGTMLKAETGVDLTTGISLDFPKLGAKATLTSSFTYWSQPWNTLITGTKGRVEIGPIGSRPTKAIVHRYTKEAMIGFETESEVIELNFPQFGLYFEADAVARSLRDGEMENSSMTHAETLLTMEIFDTVRKQNNYILPEGMEAVPM